MESKNIERIRIRNQNADPDTKKKVRIRIHYTAKDQDRLQVPSKRYKRGIYVG